MKKRRKKKNPGKIPGFDGLESGLVTSHHIETFELFFACKHFLLFLFLYVRFEESASSALGYNEVSVSLFFETSIRIFKLFVFSYDYTWH